MIARPFVHRARCALLAIACAVLLPTIHGADTPRTDAPPPALPQVPQDVDYLDLFLPLRIELAALSPDGRRIAYTLHKDGALVLVVVDTERPTVIRKSVVLLTDRDATPSLDQSTTSPVTARARWLGWSSPDWIVAETNRIHQAQLAGPATATEVRRSSWVGTPGAIVAYHPETDRARTLVTPETVALTIPRVSLAPRPRGRTLDPSQSARTPNHLHDVGWAPPDSSGETAVAANEDLILPGIPSVHGFAPSDRDTVIIRGDTVDGVNTFRLDVSTGKLQQIASFSPKAATSLLIDTAGRPRIHTMVSDKRPLEFGFMLAAASGRSRWAKITSGLPATLADGFALSAGNFLGHRAVPLTFDATGNVLFFASNLDRETFGIYGLDLQTHALTDLTIEHPTQDLYLPQPGLFPDPAVAVRPGGRTSADDAADPEIWDPRGDALQNATEEDVTEDSQLTQAYRRFLARTAVANTRRPLSDPSPLVFDRFTGDLVGVRIQGTRLTTSWFRPEIAQVQATLERELPDRHIEIKEWDDDYETFLVLAHGPSQPGTYNIYHRPENRFVEFQQRNSRASQSPDVANRTVPFAFDSPAGTRLFGTLTFPRAVRDPKAARVPLVVLCPTEPWRPFRPTYAPEVQALARMGLAVARINTRGMWGSGVANRAGLESGFDQVQAADLAAALDHLGARYPVNLRRVAILGEGLGGHLALRAVQQYPERFRCAVAIEAPISLKAWLDENRWARSHEALLLRPFFGSEATLAADPLVRGPAMQRPVCIFAFAGDDALPAGTAHRQGRAFASRVGSSGIVAEFAALTSGYLRQEPNARSEVFRQIEKFLNATVYDYLVDVGTGTVVPTP